MSKVIEFPAEKMNDAAVEIKRSKEFDAAANELSEVIRSLPLSSTDNDRLIFSILSQIGAAERGAFLHGFNLGVLTITGNFEMLKNP